MKFYISGPITNSEGFRERFKKAELALKEQGQEVINPAEILNEMPESTTHDEYMLICIELLKQCDAIFMLDGWRKSSGAREELEYALRHKIMISFE